MFLVHRWSCGPRRNKLNTSSSSNNIVFLYVHIHARNFLPIMGIYASVFIQLLLQRFRLDNQESSPLRGFCNELSFCRAVPMIVVGPVVYLVPRPSFRAPPAHFLLKFIWILLLITRYEGIWWSCPPVLTSLYPYNKQLRDHLKCARIWWLAKLKEEHVSIRIEHK